MYNTKPLNRGAFLLTQSLRLCYDVSNSLETQRCIRRHKRRNPVHSNITYTVLSSGGTSRSYMRRCMMLGVNLGSTIRRTHW